jgi:hypothetical protein
MEIFIKEPEQIATKGNKRWQPIPELVTKRNPQISQHKTYDMSDSSSPIFILLVFLYSKDGL